MLGRVLAVVEPPWQNRWIGPAVLGAWFLGIIVWLTFIATLGPATDAGAYAGMSLQDPYRDAQLGRLGAYMYSPAFAQLTEPLRWLGTDAFTLVWRLVDLAVLAALTGPLALPLAFVPAVAGELRAANIHLLLAGVIVIGFRWPAAWSFVLLTKLTPGIGLLWFAVRREWRSLGLVALATAAVVTLSAAAAPGLWLDWIAFLATPQAEPTAGPAIISLPLLPRLVAAAVIVAWGARRDQRWTVPIAVTLALPALWVAGLSIMVAIIPLIWLDRRRLRTSSPAA